MQVHTPTLADIKARAEAIRLPVEILGRLAAMPPSTAHRALGTAKDCRLSTVTKLADALAAEEARLFAHLVTVLPTAVLLQTLESSNAQAFAAIRDGGAEQDLPLR